MLTRLAEGSCEDRRPLVFVNGYQTEGRDDARWVSSFQSMGWRGPIYRYEWRRGERNSQRTIGIRGALLGVAVSELMLLPINSVPVVGQVMAARRVVRYSFLAYRVASAVASGSAGTGFSMISDFRIRFHTARREGRRLAASLAKLASDGPRPAVVGYSLGSVVTHQALLNMEPQSVDQVLLMGGVVPERWRWNRQCDRVVGRITNLYSRHDKAASVHFGRAMNRIAVGACGITKGSGKVRNYDVSEHVLSHEAFEEFVEGRFLKQRFCVKFRVKQSK